MREIKKVVIKVGSHVISDEDKICRQRVENLCQFLADLSKLYEVIFVSSGAINSGSIKSHIPKNSITNRQILASIGQPYLMGIYNEILSRHNIISGQILLTAADFDSRKRTNYAKNVIEGLCSYGVLPIINENDATGVEEIVFGDNDRLSASVAHYCNADILVILSDIDGYYDDDPRLNKDAKLKLYVDKIDESELEATPKAGTKFGTGGIVTKLKAANFLLQNNQAMFLTNGFDLTVAREFLLNGRQIGGTLFSKNNFF